MRDPMLKRIQRELKHDIGKYIALFLFLTVMIGFISGFIIGDESLKARYDSSFKEFNVEDGHFVLQNEVTPEMLAKVRKTGVEVYPLFYKEEAVQTGDAGGADGDTARIYINRGKVDLVDFWEGREPNAGDEIALDKLLVRRMRAENPEAEIFFGVRGEPIVNDALEEDALLVGMDEEARIVSNGDRSQGTVLSRVSGEFRAVYEAADVIVSKGQANFESLSEEKGNIYFLMMVKCGVIAGYTGVPEGSMVCMHKERKDA